jgi:TetR/AcrR family transcriptional regulator, fatty acid metabolism regulator protein
LSQTGQAAQPGRVAPRTTRSAQTRERIIAAATEVFARSGFHGARVADIAEHAGIAYGLVYHYFHNKDEILAAIFTERWAQYVSYLHEVGDMDLGFREQMRRLVHFWVEVYRREPDLMTVMINEVTRSYEFLESHDIATVMVAFEAIEEIIRKARERGEVSSDVDPQLASYIVFGAAEMVLTGYVMRTLRRSDPDAFARDEAQMLELLLDGLASRSSSNPGD